MPDEPAEKENRERHAPEQRALRPAVTWLVWLVGAAAIAALILIVTRRSEAAEFLQLMEQAQPGWLALALVLQAGTYFTQGAVWRLVARATGNVLPLMKASGLSLAMLFVNQALPSGGLSGVALVKGGLEREGFPPPVVAAAVLIDVATYYLAYALCLAAALVVALWQNYFPAWVILLAIFFVLMALGVSAFVMAVPTDSMKGLKWRLHRFGPVATIIAWVQEADPGPCRDARLLARALALHITTFLLDTATVWASIRALGVLASPGDVFASFMISTLFRTIGFMPGGLGTFEAASVMTLKLTGLPLPVGLSATLLFRGLSFWLPMVPGLILSRRLIKPSGPGAPHPGPASQTSRASQPRSPEDKRL